MAFYISFPGQTPELRKTPMWSSLVKKSKSGRRRAIQQYSSPLWRFEMNFEVIRNRTITPELAEMYALFCSVQGRTGTFYFIDPSDYYVVGQSLGTGTGARTVYQLSRTLAGYVASYSENVYYPIGTPTIYVNGVATTSFTLGAGGVITFSAAPALNAVLTWTGGFMYNCAMESDEIGPHKMVGDLWELDSIEFESVKY